VVAEVKFSINNYSQIFYIIGPECRGLVEFVIKELYISFPAEEYNCSFTAVDFHTVSWTPTLYRPDVRLQEKAVLRGFDGEEDFDVVSEMATVGVGNCVAYVVNEHIKEKRSQDRSLQNPREDIKRREEKPGDEDLRFTVG
jgi:hypothetical protein